MALEKEMETYNRELEKLLPDSGKYAVIIGDSVVDKFDTYGDALKAGYKQAGLEPFLVQKIQIVRQVHYI